MRLWKSNKRQKYTYKFPADKFELLEELPAKHYTGKYATGSPRKLLYHVVRIRCKKCGHEKVVCDQKRLSCKQGICSKSFRDKTGFKYGELTILGPIKTDSKWKTWQWLCRCTCGREEAISNSSLLNGKKSCTPCGRLRTIASTALPTGRSDWNRVITLYRSNAIRNSREFSLTDKECLSLLKTECYYCGAAPSPDAFGNIRNGIDRVDSSKGYTDDNCVSCCYTCNKMKNRHSPTEFIGHIKKILQHYKEKKC